MPRTRLPRPREKTALDSSLAIVNIVLLLIFFFLATGSLLNSRTVEVALPETRALPLDLLPEPLLVIDAEGGMLLNGAPIPRGSLAENLLDDPVLHILADRNGNAQALLALLAAENLVAVELRLVTLRLATGTAETDP
jgi:biopolymer transport protein ExbD